MITATAWLWIVLASSSAPIPEAENGDEDEARQDAEIQDAVDEQQRTVVVTGTRTAKAREESPVATEVYGRSDIEESGAENLAELLDNVPGVFTLPEIGGTGLQIQGLDAQHIAILVDGQRTTGRVNGILDLSRFPAEDIGQVEIVRGPGSVLYGADALAGTINLIPRRTEKPHEGQLHLAYGSFNTADVSARVGLARRKYRGSVTAGWHRTDGWDADPSTVGTTGPQSSQWNVSTNQSFDSLGFFAIDVDASYLLRNAVQVDSTASGAIFDRYNRSEVFRISARPSFDDGSSKLTLNAGYTLFRDQFVQDQRGSSELDQSQDTFDHLGQATLQYDQTIGKHTLTSGVDVLAEFLRADRIDPPTVDRQRVAMFLQDEWTPKKAPWMTVLPGLRFDYDTQFGFYPTPRIALRFSPSPRWTFRIAYGRGYRAPSFREMYLLFANPSVGYTVAGNPDLRPETSWGLSISAEIQPFRWLALTANVFDNRLQDTIVTTLASSDDPTNALYEYVNIGEATTRGVETTATVAILRMLRLEGSYAFTHSEDNIAQRPLPGRPRHLATFGLRFYRAAWGTGLRIRGSYVGSRQFFVDEDGDDVVDTVRAPAFTTLDVRLSQNVYQYLQLFVGIDNALDAGDASTNPITPRSFYGGATLSY